jgi:predicted alpha/beta-hydrolase family hydrolase
LERPTRRLTVSLAPTHHVTAIVYTASPPAEDAALMLAHGAGAGQLSPFMTAFARGLAARGVDTVTFDFPYAHEGRRIPDRRPILESCYMAALDAVRHAVPCARSRLLIGGKSMGGRIATHIAAADRDLPVCGLVLLGYPLHPPGRPDRRRDAHLLAIARPMLIVQGERDAFGSPDELAPILSRLSPPATLRVVERGDHSLRIPGLANAEQEAVYGQAQDDIVLWIREINRRAGGR